MGWSDLALFSKEAIMAFHTLLSLSVTYFDGATSDWIIRLQEDQCGYVAARSIIEHNDEGLMVSATLGHIEEGGSVTPWLTELELLPELVPIPF